MPHSLYTYLPLASTPWEDISVEFVLRLRCTPRDFTSIFVVIDHFSKMIHFFPTAK